MRFLELFLLIPQFVTKIITSCLHISAYHAFFADLLAPDGTREGVDWWRVCY